MASGRVITGFSKPYAALYTESSGTVTYTGVQALARGVEVSLEPESAEDNIFYADNVAAESASGVFTGGTVTLTVDGFFTATRRKFFGLPAAGADGWTAEGDNAVAPYVGIGYIVRYMSDGVTTYVPTILTKTKFNTLGESAATQEAEIDWQTTELTAALMRDDTSNHNWRFIGADFSTEAEAEAALIAKLGGEAPTPTTYTVTFDSNGGTEVAAQTVAEGQTATEPENPTLADYTFGGWFTDDDTFLDEYVFTTPVTANITLYAKWNAA